MRPEVVENIDDSKYSWAGYYTVKCGGTTDSECSSNDISPVIPITVFHKRVFLRLNGVAPHHLEDMIQRLESEGFFDFEKNRVWC